MNNKDEEKIEILDSDSNDNVEIVDSMNRPEPTSISAEEFERTKGSEKVGTDTQFTASVSTAVQRAHTLAEKMDAAGSKKTFSDFSCESKDGDVKLKPITLTLNSSSKAA